MNRQKSSRLVAILMCALLCSAPLHAEIVATDQAARSVADRSERDRVQTFLDRADVQTRLQALGIDGITAGDRVAALSDEEVHQLALKIDSLPAGGNLGNSDMIIILLVAILVAIAV